MANLCDYCWAMARPGDYFPNTDREDVCDGCTDLAIVARVNADEAQWVRERSLYTALDTCPWCDTVHDGAFCTVPTAS